ncbi:MAG TPA: Rrf2 family transcriptional regulator [Deltaproteobacteria bacterium]|nr:Rrf2 family transcriptional regulator [Deltaproteobacteria bacterium]
MKKIIQISEATSLALHGMGILVSSDTGRITIKEMAEITQASEAHLSKVFQRLAKSGLVRSIRGPKGGFELAKSPEEITLLDIYKAIEGKITTDTCFLQSGTPCPFGTCIFGNLVEDLTQQFMEYLDKTTLYDLKNKLS